MDHINECIAALREAAPEIDILLNEPMRRHTTFAIGGPADLFVQPKTRRELAETLRVFRERGVRFLLLGNGSNMLVADAGIRGAVVCTSELDDVRVNDDGTLVAESRCAAWPRGAPRAARGPDRRGVCRRHPGQLGRRGVYERGRIRRPDGRAWWRKPNIWTKTAHCIP